MKLDSKSRDLSASRVLHLALASLFLFASIHSSALAQSSDLRTLDAKAIKSLVEQNRGKVVLVNFFATWCPPCHKEFPGIVKLYDKYKSAGLEVIEVSMNDASEKDDIQAFLREQKPPFPVYLAASTGDAFYKSVNQRWATELPMTMIYDREGKLRYFHPKDRTYAELEQDVGPLLGSSH